MPDVFLPHTEILPAAQRRLWPDLAQVPEHFAMYDGTALALHLGHRQSVDFDFFAEQAIDPAHMLATLPLLAGATVLQQAPNTLDAVIDRAGPVTLSFFGVPSLKRLQPPHVCPGNGVHVAALLDIAGTKASVVQQRAELKDYLDIAAILADGRIDLPMMLAAGRAIYGGQFNSQITLKALSHFGDGNLATLPSRTRTLLARAVRGVDLLHLPDLAAASSP